MMTLVCLDIYRATIQRRIQRYEHIRMGKRIANGLRSNNLPVRADGYDARSSTSLIRDQQVLGPYAASA